MVQRETVIAVLETYWAGRSLRQSLDFIGLGSKQFYDGLARWPDLDTIYRAARRARGHLALDRNEEISDDLTSPFGSLDSRSARVAAEINSKLASMYAPDEYGDRIRVEHEVIDVRAALDAARNRSRRDLAAPIDVQFVEVSKASVLAAPDKASGADAAPSVGNIFDD